MAKRKGPKRVLQALIYIELIFQPKFVASMNNPGMILVNLIFLTITMVS